MATITRRACPAAAERGWAAPGYSTVAAIVNALDSALLTLAHDGPGAGVDQLHVQVGGDLRDVVACEVAAMVDVQDVGESVNRPSRLGLSPDRLAQREREVQRRRSAEEDGVSGDRAGVNSRPPTTSWSTTSTHQLQIAAHWGTGAFSTSDGQRSAARGRAAAGDPMAREFGHKRGALNLVNWVTDQYSQYGTKVVSVAEREALHMLEAILHTHLPITEHTTDTHGATELPVSDQLALPL